MGASPWRLWSASQSGLAFSLGSEIALSGSLIKSGHSSRNTVTRPDICARSPVLEGKDALLLLEKYSIRRISLETSHRSIKTTRSTERATESEWETNGPRRKEISQSGK